MERCGGPKTSLMLYHSVLFTTHVYRTRLQHKSISTCTSTTSTYQNMCILQQYTPTTTHLQQHRIHNNRYTSTTTSKYPQQQVHIYNNMYVSTTTGTHLQQHVHIYNNIQVSTTTCTHLQRQYNWSWLLLLLFSVTLSQKHCLVSIDIAKG